ncbi:MAG TPA: hypothetical protein VIN40_02300 [Candidatus Tyrphobacter sp.]
MERFISAAVAAVAAIVIIAGGLQHSSASAAAPRITPTPVALQYEQISRFVLTGTPPPPGAFQDDRASIMASANAPQSQHHGLFGNIMNSVQTAESAMQSLQNGFLSRTTYYRNWVRTDDLVHQTATITKCELHQYIELDLAHHTYKITSTEPSPQPAPAPGNYSSGTTTMNAGAPGTVDMTVTASSQNLGARTIEQIPTHGRSSSVSLVMANATGSCRNGSMSMDMEEYISGVGIPRPYCPIPHLSNVPTSPQEYVVRGGCRPRFHGSASGMSAFGSHDTGSRLAMYTRMRFGAGQTQGQGMQMVTESGNVRWLYKPEADAFFSIPPGFTRQQ